MLTSSLQHLVSIPQCEAALKLAYREQKNLLWKKLGLELQIERRREAMEATATVLERKKAELAAAGGLAAGFAHYPAVQEKYLDSAGKLDVEIALLEMRKRKQKPEWLLEKELRLHCINAAMEQLSLMILELETHKARLQKQEVQAAAEAALNSKAPAAPVIIPVTKSRAAAEQALPKQVKKWPWTMVLANGIPRVKTKERNL